jgi:hypothetical protein
LIRRLRVLAPWLDPPDESTARAYCELEIVGAQIFAAVSKMGGALVRTTPDGQDLDVRKLVDAHRRNKLRNSHTLANWGVAPRERETKQQYNDEDERE